MKTTDRAVRKASSKRLLADFARAARAVSVLGRDVWGDELTLQDQKRIFLIHASSETSRTRYACLMTAFGQ